MKQLFIFIFSISLFSHFSVSAEKANLPVLLSYPEDKELNINEIKKNISDWGTDNMVALHCNWKSGIVGFFFSVLLVLLGVVIGMSV